MTSAERANQHSTLSKLYESLAAMEGLGWDESDPLVKELRKTIKQMEEGKFDHSFEDKRR
jgi:hypothetical protein